jgi:DNA-binding MarR family transcriptional regulator
MSMVEVKPRKARVSELDSHTGFWLRFVSNHVSHAFARKLLHSGVTVAEWVVLRQMYDRQEMSPSVLADQTGMTRGAASKLVDRLLAKDLVTRKGRSDDRRFQDIALTPAGRRLVPRLAVIADENDKEFFTPLSIDEREVLVAIMKKLAQAHSLHKFPTE